MRDDLKELLRLRQLRVSTAILGLRYIDGNKEKEMNGCWALDPIREEFYKLLKIHFEWRIVRRKFFWITF
jgi:hypothetical protein